MCLLSLEYAGAMSLCEPGQSRRILAVCLALAACMFACGDDEGTTVGTSSAGCEAAQVVAPGTTLRTLISAGEERPFQVGVPDSYDGSTWSRCCSVSTPT